MSQSVDGILQLQLVDKKTTKNLSIIGVYLPLDTSANAEDNDRAFQLLVEMFYELNESIDFTMICGDLIARVGSKMVYIDTIHDIPQRVPVHQTVNVQGTSLVNLCLKNRAHPRGSVPEPMPMGEGNEPRGVGTIMVQ